MSDSAAYLAEIELALIHSPVIADYQIVRAVAPPHVRRDGGRGAAVLGVRSAGS